MLLAKFESVYTGSGDQGSSMVSIYTLVFYHSLYGCASFLLSLQFAFNMEQGLPVMPEWLFFNRVNARARKGVEIGPARLLLRYFVYFMSFILYKEQCTIIRMVYVWVDNHLLATLFLLICFLNFHSCLV